MDTLLAACVDIVPSPEMSVLGIVAEALNAAVPLPLLRQPDLAAAGRGGLRNGPYLGSGN